MSLRKQEKDQLILNGTNKHSKELKLSTMFFKFLPHAGVRFTTVRANVMYCNVYISKRHKINLFFL